MAYEIIEDITQGPKRRKRRTWILIPGGLDETEIRQVLTDAYQELHGGYEEVLIEAYQDYNAVRYAGWVARIEGDLMRLTFDNIPPLRRDLMSTYR